MNIINDIDDFLDKKDLFNLGILDTEKSHPLSVNLSDDSLNDLNRAISVIKDIDINMLSVLMTKVDRIKKLSEDINRVTSRGNKVFLCGCGATGRLSLSIESFWIMNSPKSGREHQVVAFMAGGDEALIKARENFEDVPEYGEKDLKALGFKDGDLLIASTEGGETPYVIGAVEAAHVMSGESPYFLYCNPDEILCANIERSKRVIENSGIKKINLSSGPMAIAGSTRMQASTILMLCIGLAMFWYTGFDKAIRKLFDFYKDLDLGFLKCFIEEESRIYKDKGYMFYETSDYGITVLTDTTERAPTFNLHPFENINDKGYTHSLSYLYISSINISKDAWFSILKRKPRMVNDLKYVYGYDFSSNVMQRRKQELPDSRHFVFSILEEEGILYFNLNHCSHKIDFSGLDFMMKHIILKMILNIHSTLVMGRLGRYEGNVMTWVKPSNYKLVDRAIRYVQTILSGKGNNKYSYDDIARALFRNLDSLTEEQSIVLKTVNSLLK